MDTPSANIWCRLEFMGDDGQPDYLEFTPSGWHCDGLPITVAYLNSEYGYASWSPGEGWPPAFLANSVADLLHMRIVYIAPMPSDSGDDVVH